MNRLNPNEEPLSNDRIEELRLENELMKIKMQAELGARFGGDLQGLPPEIEHQWLKDMMAFEERMAAGPAMTLKEHLGNPDVPDAESYGPEASLDEAWRALKKLLREKNIEVVFLSDAYPVRVRYDFVVRELFGEKIHPPLGEGHFIVFTYEEFHPNHFYDMEQRAHELFRLISANEFREEESCIALKLMTAEGKLLDQAAFAGKVQVFHEQFAATGEFRYHFLHRSRQHDGEELPETDLGFIEGMVQYEVTHHDGSRQLLEGPFKFFFQYNQGWWEVFFFHLYGFSWA